MKTLYVDMDNVLVDFSTGIAKLGENERVTFKGRLYQVPGVFSKMEPLEGAISSFDKLSKKFDTYILSTAPWENPSAWTDKLLWVKRHLGKAAHKRLILSHHKNLNVGDYLIDDRKKNGADKFTGEHIHFGQDEFPDWKSVCDYLLK